MWLALLLVLLSSSISHAETYPWVEARHDDLKLVTDPEVEAKVRLELIASARSTIDVVIYDQRVDEELGLPVLKALRDASERGVHVRFMTTWFPTLMKDSKLVAARYLTDPQPRGGVEYMIVGGKNLYYMGWKADDHVHEKILLVDGKVALMTGRGHGKDYQTWLDTAFLIRGALVSQISEAYGKLWRTIRAEVPLFEKTSTAFQAVRKAIDAKLAAQAELKLSATEQSQWMEVSQWLERTYTGAFAAEPSRPTRARLLHHDLFKQLRALPGNPRDYSFGERVRLLVDPVVNALVERLSGARRIKYNTLSVLPHPKFRDALYAARERGAQVEILTNGKEAYSSFLPLPMPWFLALPSMDQALQQGLSLYTFGKSPRNNWVYLHRKVAIVDDTVILGSHNFNLPSTMVNDEMSFELEDPELAREMTELFDRSIAENGTALDPAAIHRERKRFRAMTWLAYPMRGLY